MSALCRRSSALDAERNREKPWETSAVSQSSMHGHAERNRPTARAAEAAEAREAMCTVHAAKAAPATANVIEQVLSAALAPEAAHTSVAERSDDVPPKQPTRRRA